MFEDPELQDPLSLSLNENYNEQKSPHHDSKKAPASPEYNCETPEIEVIIKEEEEGWTVIENNESVSSDGEKEDASTGTCHHHFKGSTVSQSSTRERLQAKMCMDSDDRPDISCMHGKVLGKVTLHHCSNTVCDIAPSLEKNMKSNQRIAVDDCAAQERSTALQPEAELIETKLSAPYLTESFEHNPSNSRGLKQASASLEDQTLHLTVRLQAEEEEQEEDQEEEIGGLINSDGEVVEWDARNSPAQSSDHTENTHPNKTQLHQRGSCSPTLIMEVVEDEEQVQEQGSKERATVSSSQRGRRHRNKKKVPGVTVVSLETCDTEKQIPPNLVRGRGRRKVLDAQLLPSDSLEEESGIPRRTRRQRKTPATVEAKSKPVRPAAAKRPYRRRKDAKSSAEEQAENPVVSAGKKRPGRKMVHVPIEIPPELLKKPKEKIEYHCSVCGKEFPHAYKLERHELIHTGEKPYCCSICGRGFNQKGNLKTHYKVHFGGKGAVDFGDEVNSTQSDFSEYLKSLPGESKIRSSLHSFQCGKKCESQSDLQTHHITTHTEKAGEPDEVDHSSPQLFFCRRCGVQFGDKEKLEEHMKKHVKEKRHSCPDCGKRFINESYIQIHQRIHTGEKPFLCSQCDRGFHTASSLKLHEMQHSGERPFACSICGKTFRINSYLTAHYQTHVKDRPFVCSVCGKGYSRAEELKVHHRLHTGERPYECGQCGKSFIYRQGLRQHQRTHAGKRIGPTRQLGRPKQEARLDV